MFSCENCGKEFKSEKRLITHNKQCIYTDILYVCTKCHTMTYNFSELTAHKADCKGTNKKDTKTLLEKHVKKKVKKPKAKNHIHLLKERCENEFILYMRELMYKDKKIIPIGIESRILQPENYFEKVLEQEEIEEYRKALELSKFEYKPTYDSFVSTIFCYGLSLFSVYNVLKYFIGEKTKHFIIRLEDNHEYPYRFYYFHQIRKNKQLWRMDCRLENFTDIIIDNLLDYMAKLFRKNYYDVFGDNNYREVKALRESSYQIIHLDCIQLMCNIAELVNRPNTQKFLQDLIIETATVEKPPEYKFNLLSDDRMFFEKFKDRLGCDITIDQVNAMKLLFDDSENYDMKMILTEICESK